MRLTIYDIKRLSEAHSPYFFDRKSMRFFGQTLKSFSVRKIDEDTWYISAPMRDHSGRHMGTTERYFQLSTGKLSLKMPEKELVA